MRVGQRDRLPLFYASDFHELITYELIFNYKKFQLAMETNLKLN